MTAVVITAIAALTLLATTILGGAYRLIRHILRGHQ